MINGKVATALWVLLTCSGVFAQDQPPGPAWKGQIGFPEEPFASWTAPPYVKFTIIIKPGFDPNLVYFQSSARYEFHFSFALEHPPDLLHDRRL